MSKCRWTALHQRSHTSVIGSRSICWRVKSLEKRKPIKIHLRSLCRPPWQRRYSQQVKSERTETQRLISGSIRCITNSLELSHSRVTDLFVFLFPLEKLTAPLLGLNRWVRVQSRFILLTHKRKWAEISPTNRLQSLLQRFHPRSISSSVANLLKDLQRKRQPWRPRSRLVGHSRWVQPADPIKCRKSLSGRTLRIPWNHTIVMLSLHMVLFILQKWMKKDRLFCFDSIKI